MASCTALRRVLLLAQLALVVLPASARAQVGAAPLGASDSVDVLVATRRLPRGTVLRASDMAAARVARRRTAGRVAGPNAEPHAERQPGRESGDVVSGWVARRVIQAGEVLRAPAVAPAPLVAAGQTVQYTYQQDGLALTLDGVAPVAGSLGDTIPVRLGARRRVSGIVAGPAHVVALASPRIP